MFFIFNWGEWEPNLVGILVNHGNVCYEHNFIATTCMQYKFFNIAGPSRIMCRKGGSESQLQMNKDRLLLKVPFMQLLCIVQYCRLVFLLYKLFSIEWVIEVCRCRFDILPAAELKEELIFSNQTIFRIHSH